MTTPAVHIDLPMVPLAPTLPFPFYPSVPEISLELTNNCNLKCPYCANIVLTRPKTYIAWPLLEKIVNECAERGYNLAYLHGVGEPLLWDRLEEVVSLIKTKGAGSGSFATNGTLLSADRVRRLLDAGLESIYVSIDSLDPAIYKATRGGKVEKVIRNIQTLIAIAPPTFQITVALMNHKDNEISQATIDHFHKTFGFHANVNLNLIQNQIFPGAPADYRVVTSKFDRCFEPANYVFIALDGRVGICCKDQNIQHSLGSVAEQSIHDIWFDPVNQTTFRNIALGVFSCPEVCTKVCVLNPPKQDASMVTPGFGLAFDEALALAANLVNAGAGQGARDLVHALGLRNPTNQQVRTLWKAIKTAAVPAP